MDKKTISEAMRLMGRRGGKRSMGALTPEERTRRGKESAAKLTPEQRTARARKAAEARWGKASRKAAQRRTQP